MDQPAKRLRRQNILIRLCDKFSRNEVNVICPVIKAENSVRVLYKLQKDLFKDTLRNAEELNGLTFVKEHWDSPDNKMNGSTLFLEYFPSQYFDENECRTLKKNLELQFEAVLKGRRPLIDEVEDMQQTVPQPVISELDFELHKLKLFSQEVQENSELPELRALVDTTELDLKDLKECYTTFAMLSQNGKGKSFILNLLLLMTVDSEEEYVTNNRYMQLPQGFPDQWKTLTQSNFPEVVKDFMKDKTVEDLIKIKKSNKYPIFHQLTCNKDIKESVASFLNLDTYFSERRTLDLEPYVLSQKEATGSYESTTKCIMHMRYGTCYQMKVEYYDAEELQQQLYDLFIKDIDDSNVNIPVKEQSDKCLKARYKDLIGHEFTEEEPVSCYEDIHLSREVLEFAGKTELYIGQGENPTLDRLALQDVLKALTTVQEEDTAQEAKKKIAAMKEILVYVPSKILHGNKEILEMPGTDDSDQIAMFSIRNALMEKADAVIFLSEFGFVISEKEVKSMLSDSGFLQKFEEDPIKNKLMLIAYPEKNQKWQFSRNGKNKIENVEQEASRKKQKELKEFETLLKRKSVEHEKSIFTTYLLPVLHSSILSQKDPQQEHEVIAKHSDFLNHTGIMDLFIQLDEYLLSKQKASFEQVKKSFESFLKKMNPEMNIETAGRIVQKTTSNQFQQALKEQNQKFEENLNKLKNMLLENVDEMVETLVKEYIPEAKLQWNTNNHKVTSMSAYNPNFIGKSPKFKVRLFNIFFEAFDQKKEEMFDEMLQQINNVFEKYKTNVLDFYTKQLNDFLNPLGLAVSLKFVTEAIIDKLNDAHQRYMGNIKRPFNKKTLGKLMDESQRASLKTVILERNFKKPSLEEAKESTEDDIEECMMNVKHIFMMKLNDLHNYRFRSVRTLLWTPNGGSKIWKQLDLELKRTARDRNEERLERVIEKLQILMTASFNGSD